jgi:hypothetical protein
LIAVCHKSLIFPFFLLLSTDAGKEETAFGVYWVTDGIDRCLVGFLPRHCIHHKDDYNGRVAQVVEFLKESENPAKRRRSHSMKGVCMAALLQPK